MTILDSIKAAEEKAKELKHFATVEAREYLREAESETNREADELVTKARAAAREKVAAAEKQSAVRLQELLAERDSQNRVLAEQSAKQIDQAAEFIVGKVVN